MSLAQVATGIATVFGLLGFGMLMLVLLRSTDKRLQPGVIKAISEIGLSPEQMKEMGSSNLEKYLKNLGVLNEKIITEILAAQTEADRTGDGRTAFGLLAIAALGAAVAITSPNEGVGERTPPNQTYHFYTDTVFKQISGGKIWSDEVALGDSVEFLGAADWTWEANPNAERDYYWTLCKEPRQVLNSSGKRVIKFYCLNGVVDLSVNDAVSALAQSSSIAERERVFDRFAWRAGNAVRDVKFVLRYRKPSGTGIDTTGPSAIQ
jgi:hypothetical protein